MQEIPIYLITGFLEAGKTDFLSGVLMGGDFDDGQRGLLILCEEGEEEYDEAALEAMKISVTTVDEEEEFTPEYLKKICKEYNPERIFIEMNGMWDFKWMFEEELPRFLEVVQVISIVDASTFQVFQNNPGMRSIISNFFQSAELVMFNRCTDDMDLASFRRIVRGLNQRAMVYFEDVDGEPVDPGMDEPPYDYNADLIEIGDTDYGIFHLDAMENEDRYKNKKVRFRAKIMKNRHLPEDTFVPGRNIVTCCADDIRFMGYMCKAPFASQLKARQWVYITATVKYEYCREYGGEGPVLYGERYELTGEPETDEVYIF